MSRLPASPGVRELGVVNWVICKVMARGVRAPEMHLATTLAQHRLLFKSWLPLGAMLLQRGRLSRQDTELVILRVGHLRDCEYELQHHRRLARRRGIDTDLQEKIFAGPRADGLTEHQRVLLTATDELLLDRAVTDPTWNALSRHLDNKQLIEFCMLAGHYDVLAATLNTLKVPFDYPN